MANELNLDLTPARTGYTMTVQLLLNGTAYGSPISATEPTPGYYTATMTAPAGNYAVRFIVDGDTIGTGFIRWDGTAEITINDLPTLTQLEARTLPGADYFNPATDTVATVTSITNPVVLPTIPANWITAAGLAVDAVIAIQSGLATDADVTAILEDTGTTLPGLIAALPTLAQVQAAGFTTTRNDALISMEAYTRPMAKQLGLVSGISTTHSPTAIVVSDGDGSTTITDNGGGSYTVALT